MSLITNIETEVKDLAAKAEGIISHPETLANDVVPVMGDVAGLAASIETGNVAGVLAQGVHAVSDITAAVGLGAAKLAPASASAAGAAAISAVSALTSAVPSVHALAGKLIAGGIVAVLEIEFGPMPDASKARVSALISGLVSAIAGVL